MRATAMDRQSYKQIRRPNEASIFTTELQAIKMILEPIKNSIRKLSQSQTQVLQLQKKANPNICTFQTYQKLIVIQLNHKNQSSQPRFEVMYVGILGNVKADKLAKDVLKITTTNINIRDTDFRNKIKIYQKKVANNIRLKT